MNITNILLKSISKFKSNVYLNYILDGVTEMPCRYLLASILSECIGEAYVSKELKNIVSPLLKIKIDKKLISYNRDSCIRIIQNNLAELSDDECYNIIRYPVIKKIKDNTVYFDVDKYKSIRRPQLRTYGDIEYTDQKLVEKNKDKVNEITPCQINEYESELISIWKQIKELDGFEECMPFVWKLSISNAIYLKLKTALIKTIPNLKPSKILENYSLAIFVYVALWYRWEYNGNNDENNALQDINSKISISKIWEKVPKMYRDYYLYTSQQDRQLLLYSLYVLGGFPLSYITNNKRFDSLFKEIHSLSEIEYDDEHLQRVIDCFDGNNQAYKQSFINGSFKEYVIALLNDDIYVNDSDSSLDLVKEFKKLVNDGKRESLGDIFTYNYLFYLDNESTELECVFRLKIGTNISSMYIPNLCLQVWSLRNDLKEFYIGIETNTGIKSNDVIRFTRCNYGKDEFVGWGTQNELEISLDDNEVSTINVIVYTDCLRVNTIKTIETIDIIEKGYLQLYTTGSPFEWSTKTNNKGQSALIYKTGRYELIDNSEIIQSKSFLGEHWDFLTLSSNVQLKERSSNGQTIVIWPTKGKLVVTFKTDSCLCYYDKKNALVEYYNRYEDVEQLVLLLGTNCIRRINLYPFEEGQSIERIDINNQHINISCKQGDEWVNFSPENIKAGKLRLRIQYKNYVYNKDCYYVPAPSGELVKIDIENSRINWIISAKTLSIYEPSIANEQPSSDHIKLIEGYTHSQMNRNETGKFSFNDKAVDADAIQVPFLLKNNSEDGYLFINTWRARKSQEIYSYGKKIIAIDKKRNNEKTVEIDYILKDNFEIRYLNTNLDNNVNYGIKVCKIDHHFFDPFCIPGEEGIIVDDGLNVSIHKYATTNKWIDYPENNVLKLKVGNKDEYKFYIWNMSVPEKNPKPVDSYYNEQDEELYLYIDLRPEHDDMGGIIVFQSLKGVTPNYYLAPKYVSRIKPYSYFRNLSSFNDKTILGCYQVACEHQIYFSQFAPLQKVSKNIDLLMKFIKCIFESRDGKLSENDYQNLTRFADEFIFDWLLLPFDKWKKLFNDYKDCIKTLFMYTALARDIDDKSYLPSLFDRYFRIGQNIRDIRSWSYVQNTIMKCIGVYTEGGIYRRNSEYAIINCDYDGRKKILNEILSSDTNIISTLIEDIENQRIIHIL